MWLIYRVNAGFLPASHWLHDAKQGGGRIVGEGCHFIDFLSYLIGDIPISVSAFTLPDDDRYHQDNVVMTFRFANGSIGTVTYLAKVVNLILRNLLKYFRMDLLPLSMIFVLWNWFVEMTARWSSRVCGR